MDYVARINLKTGTESRSDLVDLCLGNDDNQFLAIGWSCVYSEDTVYMQYIDYYNAVRDWSVKNNEKLRSVLNLFKDTEAGDLFWTRDLNGYYWICRATEKAKPFLHERLDIGAIVPVKAYKCELEVPGQIKASFSRFYGGTAERIWDKAAIEYSKYIYNKMSNTQTYGVNTEGCGGIIDNLPDFELEELVISYIQIKYDYFVLSNSIANKSTTMAIECEFASRNKKDVKRAVVQVKGGKRELDAHDYESFADSGFEVFLYAGKVNNADDIPEIICISKNDLQSFYDEYKAVLPENITQWENIFN